MNLLSFACALLCPLISLWPVDVYNVAGQDASSAWTKEELKMANTAGNSLYLNRQERDLVMYMNLARVDGERFFNTFFQEYVDVHNARMRKYSNYNALRISRTGSYYRSLERDMKAIKGLNMLYPDQALTRVAAAHVRDLDKNNLAAHNSSDGRTAKDRINQAYPNRTMAENIAFGFDEGLANVCMLLLDQGVPNLGHREVMLSKKYKLNFVGVSIGPHKGYRYCAVIDFVSLPVAENTR
jgi:hypothetical protein